MKLSEKLNTMFNTQVTHERKNNAIYLQIGSYFEDMQLIKLANFFMSQAEQENGHAKKVVDHLNNRVGGKVTVQAVEAPSIVINSTKDIADLYLKTEIETTKALESIYKVAMDEGSFIDLTFLHQMLEEQIEEEDLAAQFALQIQMCKDLVLYNNTFTLG